MENKCYIVFFYMISQIVRLSATMCPQLYVLFDQNMQQITQYSNPIAKSWQDVRNFSNPNISQKCVVEMYCLQQVTTCTELAHKFINYGIDETANTPVTTVETPSNSETTEVRASTPTTTAETTSDSETTEVRTSTPVTKVGTPSNLETIEKNISTPATTVKITSNSETSEETTSTPVTKIATTSDSETTELRTSPPAAETTSNSETTEVSTSTPVTTIETTSTPITTEETRSYSDVYVYVNKNKKKNKFNVKTSPQNETTKETKSQYINSTIVSAQLEKDKEMKRSSGPIIVGIFFGSLISAGIVYFIGYCIQGVMESASYTLPT